MSTMGQEQPLSLAAVPNGGWDERVHLFRAGDEVDTCVVVTQRYLVLVDTMSTPELAAAIMDAMQSSLAGRQLVVVNTHAHYDHCWGNALFATPGGRYPAPIIAHEQMRRLMQKDGAATHLAEQQEESARYANVQLIEPTITFRDDLFIDGGDLTLRLLHTPGHAADHLVILIPELLLLLAGDAAEHPFPALESAETLPSLRASLERMATLSAETVIPCHGGTTDPALITRNMAYFDAVERRVRSALAAGSVPPDWRERADLPALIGFAFEEAAQQAGANPERVPAFYRGFHLAAVRATLASLQAPLSA